MINIAALVPYDVQTVRNDQSKANSPPALSNYLFIIEASFLYSVVQLFYIAKDIRVLKKLNAIEKNSNVMLWHRWNFSAVQCSALKLSAAYGICIIKK